MSGIASTSALRMFTLRQSVSRIASSSRQLYTPTSSRLAKYESKGNDASPARAHRAEAEENNRAASGPDLDPASGVPRNASTKATTQARLGSAEALANMAQSLRDSHLSIEPQVEEVRTPIETHSYSTTLLPLKTDPTLEAFVNNLMKDGKKATATRHILEMLEYLSQALHADPLPAVQSAIQSAGPLVRMQSRKSGGKNVAVPIALRAEQSRRRGIISIIETSKKRNDKKLSIRLAKEIIAVLEGSSSTLTRKEEMHRLAMVNRSNASVRI